MNAYEIYKEVRDGIGEEVASHWGDRTILSKMNQAQKVLWRDLVMSAGDWFLVSEDITPVGSVVVLPDDCGKVAYLEITGTRVKIPIMGVREKEIGQIAYFTKEGLKISTEDFSSQVTLWYVKRLANMHFGTAGEGSGTNAIGFDKTKAPEFKTDYYLDLDIEVWDMDFLPKIESTISGYLGSSNVATIVGEVTAGDLYGTVPSLPEEGHYLIALDVINKCLMKPGSNFDMEYVKLSFASLKMARADWLDWIDMRSVQRTYISRGEEV